VQAGSVGELGKRRVASENLPRGHNESLFDGAKSIVLMPKAYFYRKVQIFFKKNQKKSKKVLTVSEMGFTFCKM